MFCLVIGKDFDLLIFFDEVVVYGVVLWVGILIN